MGISCGCARISSSGSYWIRLRFRRTVQQHSACGRSLGYTSFAVPALSHYSAAPVQRFGSEKRGNVSTELVLMKKILLWLLVCWFVALAGCRRVAQSDVPPTAVTQSAVSVFVAESHSATPLASTAPS